MRSNLLIAVPGAMLRIFVLLALFAFATPGFAQQPDDAERESDKPNRLEQIERIRKEFAPADPNRPFGPEHRITVSGKVVTADGSALPEGLSVGGMSSRTGYGGSFSAAIDAEGNFRAQVEFGRVSLHATAPAYAPALLAPLSAEPGGKIEDVRIVLDRGFAGKIRLIDDQGEPIAGVKIQTTYMHGQNGSFAHVAPREVTTGEQGVVVLENCADYPLTVEAEPAGYQADRTELKLRPDAATEWKLKKARPTTGVVVTHDEGKPITGAEVRLVQRDGFRSASYSPNNQYPPPPLLATTDDEGRFTVDSLRDDCTYVLYVKSPGCGGEIVSGIRSGKSDVKVELGPPRFIRGKLVGDLSRLERRNTGGAEEPFFRYLNPLRLGNMIFQTPITVPVTIVDGEGTFDIPEVLPGQVRLELPGQVKTLQVRDAIDDVVIELSPPQPAPASPAAAPRRKVVLKLKIPEGEPPPRGELIVHCYPTRPSGTYERKVFPLNGSQVEFDAPVPCRLQWQSDNLVGYWLKMEQIELAEAANPLVKEIDALPAGAVYGQVTAPDGTLPEGFMLLVHTVSPAPEVQNGYWGTVSTVNQSGDGRFVVGPLPLGGVYRIEVQGQGDRINTRAASEDLSLTREQSVRRVELRMPEGTAIAGQVLDPDGKPVTGVEVRLGHRTANRSHEGASQRTDDDGRFRFLHVNPELPGTYYVHVQPQEKYRGQQAIWKPGSELTVQVKRGWSLEGVLLEHNTGKIIPGATLYAQPAVYDQHFYLGRHEVRTDAAGRFRYDTLEPIPYRLYANGVNASQGAPPWEVDPRSTSEIILSGDVQQGSELLPVPPPPDGP